MLALPARDPPTWPPPHVAGVPYSPLLLLPTTLPTTSGNLTIIGPYNLTQGGIGIVGMQAIFVNGTRNTTFDIPPGKGTLILSAQLSMGAQDELRG